MRCKHCNYIAPGETQVNGEAELLFSPYSPFEVLEVPNFTRPPPPGEGFYKIVISSFAEGDESKPGGAREDLPLIVWH